MTQDVINFFFYQTLPSFRKEGQCQFQRKMKNTIAIALALFGLKLFYSNV